MVVPFTLLSCVLRDGVVTGSLSGSAYIWGLTKTDNVVHCSNKMMTHSFSFYHPVGRGQVRSPKAVLCPIRTCATASYVCMYVHTYIVE